MYSIKFKKMSLESDAYGNCLVIQMVQIFEDGKFKRNAKINDELLELLKVSELTLNLTSLSISPKVKK
jgi:hypothetical protein|tara:strand:+ start:1169 stop:1372 length:204 start_codon:yes stop_codon:yes gene_type:complete